MKTKILVILLSSTITLDLALGSCTASASLDALYSEASSNYSAAYANAQTAAANYAIWADKSSAAYKSYLNYYDAYMKNWQSYQSHLRIAGGYQRDGYNSNAQANMTEANLQLGYYKGNLQYAIQQSDAYTYANSQMTTYNNQAVDYNSQAANYSALMTSHNASIQSVCSASGSAGSTSSVDESDLDEELDADTQDVVANRLQYSGSSSTLVEDEGSFDFLDTVVSASATLSGTKLKNTKLFDVDGARISIPSGSLKSFIKTSKLFIIKFQIGSHITNVIVDRSTMNAFLIKDTAINYVTSLTKENLNVSVNGVSKSVDKVRVKNGSGAKVSIGLFVEDDLLKAVDL